MSSKSPSKSTETQTGNSPSAWRRREKDRRAGFIGLSILVHGMMATLILFYGQRILQLGGGGQDGSGVEEFGQSGVQAGVAGSGADLNTAALEVVQLGDSSPTTQAPDQTPEQTNNNSEPAAPSDVVLPQPSTQPSSQPSTLATIQPPTKPANQIDSTPKTATSSSKKSTTTKLASPIRNVETRPLESESPIEEPPQLMANPPDVAEEKSEETPEVADESTDSNSEKESEQEQPEPTSALVATQIVDDAPEKTEAPIEPEVAEPVEAVAPVEKETPKALVTKSTLSEETSESVTQTTTQESTPESVKEAGAIAGTAKTEQTKSASTTGESGGAAGQGGGDSRGLKGPITGAVGVEIRDASELAALPGNPKPSYPAQDRLRKYEGKAVLVGRVGADGRMSQVLVERSSGSTAMDASAIEAFKRWRYRPGQQSWVRQPFQFRLIGEATEIPARLGQNSSHR
ncbi:MAG TPA: TonB family protein [Pseudobdellovibrionaceae bacterium]|nr:TonB family protein [Pseudobdellovibrionaceae bacterium]